MREGVAALKARAGRTARSFARAWLACVAAGSAALVLGAPADIARGLQWLQSQVQAGGTLAGQPSAGAQQQAQCQAAATLVKLAADSPHIAALVAALQSDTATAATETVACVQQLRQQLGQIILNPEVESRRVPGQGYAAYPGFGTSSAIDTGWALAAELASLAENDKGQLLGWLQSTQAADGSFAVGGRADMVATAVVLAALRQEATQSNAAATMAGKAAQWLLSQRQAQGLWLDDAAVTALVFEAVHPYTASDPSIAPAVEAYLLAKQQADGSWNADAYTTAVALRALALVRVPALDPSKAGFKARFVDARTGLAVPGVQLASATPVFAAVSDASGVIEKGNLAPASYSFVASLAGYATVNVQATLLAGRVLDLGILQLIAPASETTAVVSGTVREHGSNAPVAGATIVLEGQGLSALSGADGSYLLTGVVPGPVTLAASKPGYFGSSGAGTALAGQVLNFSPALQPDSGSTSAGCRLVGLVRNGASQQPLAGVDIVVSGANSAAVTTDAAGRFTTPDLVSGALTVAASKFGYDTVVAATQLACPRTGTTSIDFSPLMYASGASPANANTSALSGMVIDAGTNLPIAGAAVVATMTTGSTRNAMSAADGSFRIPGLGGAQVSLKVQATGYDNTVIAYALLPLQDLEVGQVRLRRTGVQQLLPDMKVVSVRRTSGAMDAQTLALSGQVEVKVMNAGSAPTQAGTVLLAFGDSNADQVYQSGDVALGSLPVPASILPGASLTLMVNVSGTLPFRDAPIVVVADADEVQPDANRLNNVASTAAAALVQPTPADLEPELKWHWKSTLVQPSSVQVESGILAGPFEDTNLDGKLDGTDVPRVIFITYTLPDSEGVLRVVDGRTGAEVRSLYRPGGIAISGYPGFAGADVNQDGVSELFIPTMGGQLMSVSPAGKVNWVTSSLTGGAAQPYGGGPSVADIDADGVPEVLFGPYVLNARTGSVKWVGTKALNGAVIGFHSIAADLEGNGEQRVIVGPSVYRPNGQLVWERRDIGSGYTAVMKLPDRPGAQIVAASGGRVYLLDKDGNTVWGPVQVGGRSGAPIVADLDGDGLPDIGVAGSTLYTAIRSDGSILWQKPVTDGSGQTGSSSFDFDGDGDADIVYADERFVFVLDGKTGTVKYQLPHSNGTAGEQTVVADVDNDGHADFLVASDIYAGGSYVGVRAFRGKGNRWLPTRSVWNQYAYSITNINDDLTVPQQPEPSWRAHNTFRLNKRLDADPRAVPDLTVGYLRVADNGAAGSTLTFRAGNAGSYKVLAGTRFAVYNADPALGQPPAAARVGTLSLPVDLPPGEWRDLNMPLGGPLWSLSTSGRVWIVGDDDGTGQRSIDDFDRSNNVHQGDLRAVAIHLVPAVSTDKPTYIESDVALFATQVVNAGSYAGQTAVRYTVRDANGQQVEVLPLTSSTNVPAPGSVAVTAPWSVGGVLAGSYNLTAELVGPSGQVYGTATTTFAVTASQAQSALARITADRVSYSAAQTVQLTSRVSNATSNSPLEGVVARTTVTNASGGPVFTRSEAIDQLAPSTHRQYGYAQAASGLGVGSYVAKLELVSATGAVLAQSTTNFSVLGADVTGVGLTGKLQATPSTLFVGQGTQLALQATNGSSTSLTNVPLTVRVVDPESGTVIASFTSTVSDWQAGQTQSVSFPWMAVGNHNQTLVAAASAQVGGKEIQLAQANLKILGILYTGSTSVIPEEVEAGSTAALNYAVTNPAPVAGRMVGDLTVQTLSGQQLASWPLDLNIGSNSTFAGNQLYVTGEQQQKLNLVLRQQLGSRTVVLSTSPFSIIDPPVPVDVTTGLKKKARILVLVSCPPGLGTKEDAECVAQRSQAITTYLTGLGYTAKAVSTGEAFLAEMRCGTYNTYWVSGGAMKLEVQTIGELRESVRRGEALWMDGVHDSRNQLLHDVAGVKKLGKLSGSGYTAALAAGGVYEAQNLPTMGQPEKFELTTGVQQGSFAPESGQQIPVPAVISNDWGSGKSLLFAFDLAAMITADVVQANGQLAAFVSTSAGHAAGGTVTLTVGDVTQLAAQITNRGTRTVSFKAEAQLPVGLISISTSPAAQLTPKDDGTTTATWTFTLKEGATQELTWLVRATQAGTFSTPLAIYSLPREGSTAPPKLRASTTIEAEVKDAAPLLQEPAAAIDALQPSASSDKTNLVKAMQAVNAASSLHASGGYEQAIVQWLAAADALANIKSADTTQAKRAVALALEATTDAMCIQRCGSAGCQ